MNNDNSTGNQPSRNKRSKMKLSKKQIAIIVVSIIALIGVAIYTATTIILGRVTHKEIDETNLGIKPEVTEKVEHDKINNIVNVALFGLDGENGEEGRSDATMVATFDPISKKLKITSFLRDTYVAIDGYGRDKLNHSYAYGGPELAIKTLNQNFDLNITDYVKIDFENLEHVVDALGGIEMEMTQVEADEVSAYASLVSSALNRPNEPVTLKENGKADLTGFQALGYCRIRSTAGGDFARTERHRKILTEMFNKISQAGTAELASMTVKLLPYVETSLTNKEILDLAYNVLTLGTKDIKQERFPRDEYLTETDIDRIFYFCYDEEYTAQQVHEYIFNDKELWLEENQKVYVPDIAKYGGVLYGTRDNYVAPSVNNTPDPQTTPVVSEKPQPTETPTDQTNQGQVDSGATPSTPPTGDTGTDSTNNTGGTTGSTETPPVDPPATGTP